MWPRRRFTALAAVVLAGCAEPGVAKSSKSCGVAPRDCPQEDPACYAQPPYSMSGTVTFSGGGGAASGVTVTLGWEAGWADATTDSSGRYAFEGLPHGFYGVRPWLCGYDFAPFTRSYDFIQPPPDGGHLADADFLAIPSRSVFGTITLAGTGAAASGVRVTLLELSTRWQASTQTAQSGRYTVHDVPSGVIEVTPSLSGYAFAPEMRVYDLPGQGSACDADFTALPPP